MKTPFGHNSTRNLVTSSGLRSIRLLLKTKFLKVRRSASVIAIWRGTRITGLAGEDGKSNDTTTLSMEGALSIVLVAGAGGGKLWLVSTAAEGGGGREPS